MLYYRQFSSGCLFQPGQEALGRSQGGFSTKIHVRSDGNARPMTFVLTAGQRHEAVAFEALMTQGLVQRPGQPGQPKRRPHRVVADKGYSSRKIRAWLRRRGISLHHPAQDQ